jgi:CubicO group peptidase (beta-lactamase class C family)
MKSVIFSIILTTSFLAMGAPNLESIRTKYGLAAIGSLLSRNGNVSTNVAGVRKVGDATPATVNDRFHIGSCTKAMTATLIAIFAERGLVGWEMKLSDLFPELDKTMDPAFRNVPLKMLPGMHSGMTDNFSKELERKLFDPKSDLNEVRKLIAKEGLSFPPTATPGTKYDYNNANYVVVAAALERISGKSWETLMKEEIFHPLKMESCGFGPQADPNLSPPNEPWPHLIENEKIIAITPDFLGDNPPTIGPAGTVHCSMKDWLKFIQIHMDGAVGKDTTLLKAASFPIMHENHPDQTFTYGGWTRLDIEDGYFLAYVGSNLMNLANIWAFPQKQVVALSVTNTGGGKLATTPDDPALKATNDVLVELLK